MIGLSIAAFAVCMMIAMVSYPGGSHFDPRTSGYGFFENFWCDLLRDPAINGQPNPIASLYAQIAMGAVSVGLFPFFFALSDLSGNLAGVRVLVRGLGMLGIVGLLGVALFPSSDYPRLHGVLVTSAGPLGIGGALVGFVAALRAQTLSPAVVRLGFTTLLLATINVFQFAREFYFAVPNSPLLAAIQKLVTLSMLAWMLAVGRSWKRLYDTAAHSGACS